MIGMKRSMSGAAQCDRMPRAQHRLAMAALALFCATPSRAQSPDAITRPVSIYVAGTSGSGIDLNARLLGRYLGRHIDGNPTIDVQEMPGAGGIRAASFLAELAPKDGTAIATFAGGGPLIEPLIGARNPGYDMTQFQWLGTISGDVSVCISWNGGPFNTIQDAMKQEMMVAGTGAGSETDTYPVVLNAVLGTKFKIVTGYPGSQETFLAIENGEVNGRCGLSYSTLTATKPDWIRDHKINILLQMALAKSPDLPDVPLALDLIAKPEDKKLLELLMIGTIIGRPFAVPPGTPAGKVANLRRAFAETMHDPAFLADAATMQAEISPTLGPQVQDIVAQVYATPKPIIERAKVLLNPK
jgi:tripartite-type tricarboxylate transporter receptor subunit TctC